MVIFICRVIRSTPKTAQTTSLESAFKMSHQNGDNALERSESQDSIPSRVASGPSQGFPDEGLDGAVSISPTTAHALLKTTSVRYTKLANLQQKR